MPTRPRTPAQIAASRNNGRRSRGPTTDAGKRRSSLNALKHGLRSAAIRSLSKQEELGAEALTAAVLDRLQPADEAERELADAIIAALWRLRRARQIEAELLGLRAGTPDDAEPEAVARAFVRSSHQPRTMDLLLRYRTQAVNELGRLVRLHADLTRQKPPVTIDLEMAANDNRPASA